MKRFGLVILITGLMSPVWAAAEGFPTDKSCASTEQPPICGPHKRPLNKRLRGLRLQTAVHNGDLTEEEARRLEAGPFDGPPPPPPHVDRPDLPPDAGRAERRFWREQRWRALHAAPPSLPD